MNKTSWPEQVPVLEKRDMCKGTQHRGERHCLLGWLQTVFSSGAEWHKAWNAIQRECGGGPLSVFNDSRPLSESADAWNRAMRELGYTEVMDEV